MRCNTDAQRVRFCARLPSLFSMPPAASEHSYVFLIMPYDREILDQKVGRNAQLFAQAIACLDTPRARFPYLRILVSLIEKAHPEWDEPVRKRRRVARLVGRMSEGALCEKEVTGVIEVRDDEQQGERQPA